MSNSIAAGVLGGRVGGHHKNQTFGKTTSWSVGRSKSGFDRSWEMFIFPSWGLLSQFLLIMRPINISQRWSWAYRKFLNVIHIIQSFFLFFFWTYHPALQKKTNTESKSFQEKKKVISFIYKCKHLQPGWGVPELNVERNVGNSLCIC